MGAPLNKHMSYLTALSFASLFLLLPKQFSLGLNKESNFLRCVLYSVVIRCHL